MLFVTGGLGFIGSNFILEYINHFNGPIINIDKGNKNKNFELKNIKSYSLENFDLNEKSKLSNLFKKYKPQYVVHFAAETHVDKSIYSPINFLKNNVEATLNLLEVSNDYYKNLDNKKKNLFKFLHISTDEVYGSLEKKQVAFSENSQYRPNNPYSASKASSDHFVRAFFKTFNFPSIIIHSSNNYGPFQNPEKFIPLIIDKCINLKKIPIYGNGEQIRDWIFVKDFCKAIVKIIKFGRIGQVYNVGGKNQISNLKLVSEICNLMQNFLPNDNIKYIDLAEHVVDRKGHDIRYSLNINKVKNELNWEPVEKFKDGLKKTILWYLENRNWLSSMKDKDYDEWIKKNYNPKEF